MSKNKLEKFAEMEGYDHVIEPSLNFDAPEDFHLKGKWKQDFFGNDHPIILELGCGKGEYTIGLSDIFPEHNFIGVDIKGARIWRGAKTVHERNFENVAFIRTRVDFIHYFFGAHEVDAIWLTFSDPQPKKPNKRLSSRLFIERYLQFLKPGGHIHVKTDSDLFIESTLEEIESHGYEVIEKSFNVYEDLVNRRKDWLYDAMQIKTFYEKMWLKEGRTIKYLEFVPQ